MGSGYIIRVIIHVPPTPEQALADLSAVIPLLRHGLEAGTLKASEAEEKCFGNDLADPWLRAHIVRYETRSVLLDEGVDIEVDEELALSGLRLSHAGYDIRVLKADSNGGMPVPGRSRVKQQFFCQESFPEIPTQAGNLIVLWHLNPDGSLDYLSLACPKHGDTYSAECYWHVEIPPEAEFEVPPDSADGPIPDDLPIDRNDEQSGEQQS